MKIHHPEGLGVDDRLTNEQVSCLFITFPGLSLEILLAGGSSRPGIGTEGPDQQQAWAGGVVRGGISGRGLQLSRAQSGGASNSG